MNNSTTFKNNIVRQINEVTGQHYNSIYIFGSYARGDYNKKSDIDVLVLVDSYVKGIQIGKINVSFYTKAQLLKFSSKGSLFVYHLIIESVYVAGEDILSDLTSAFVPMDYMNFYKRLCEASSILDVNAFTFHEYGDTLINVQRFILRSLIYQESIQKNHLTFSISIILDKLNKHQLNLVFDREWQLSIDYDKFNDINKKIHNAYGCSIINKYESIEAAVLNFANKNKMAFSLGMSILKKDSNGLDYSTLF